MVKGLIFDLDGTLLDTLIDINICLNNILNKYNFNSISLDETKSYLGYGPKYLIKKSLGINEISSSILELMVNDYNELFNIKHHNNNTKPYKDILKMLTCLKDLNIKLAITSNKVQESVSKLNISTYNNLFDVSYGFSQNTPLKPNPTMIYKALEDLNLGSYEVLFIGDTEVDLLAASNANINSVGVTWGFRSRKQLENASANYLIDNPLELVDLVKKINSEVASN